MGERETRLSESDKSLKSYIHELVADNPARTVWVPIFDTYLQSGQIQYSDIHTQVWATIACIEVQRYVHHDNKVSGVSLLFSHNTHDYVGTEQNFEYMYSLFDSYYGGYVRAQNLSIYRVRYDGVDYSTMHACMQEETNLVIPILSHSEHTSVAPQLDQHLVQRFSQTPKVEDILCAEHWIDAAYILPQDNVFRHLIQTEYLRAGREVKR